MFKRNHLMLDLFDVFVAESPLQMTPRIACFSRQEGYFVGSFSSISLHNAIFIFKSDSRKCQRDLPTNAVFANDRFALKTVAEPLVSCRALG